MGLDIWEIVMISQPSEYIYLVRRDVAINSMELMLSDTPCTKEEELINAGVLRAIDAFKNCPIFTRVRRAEDAE